VCTSSGCFPCLAPPKVVRVFARVFLTIFDSDSPNFRLLVALTGKQLATVAVDFSRPRLLVLSTGIPAPPTSLKGIVSLFRFFSFLIIFRP